MRRFCCSLLPVLVAGLVLFAGCDSGGGTVPGNLGENTTVNLTEPNVTVIEGRGTDTLSIEVTDPGYKEFGVDVSVDESQSTAVLGEDVQGLPADTTIIFPRSATTGSVQNLIFDVTEDREALGDLTLSLSIATADTSGATVGESGVSTVSILDNDLLWADFSDDELPPMMAYSVASNNDWGTSSEGGADNAPYAVANGFEADAPSNDWLISPALNFNDFGGETLTFLNAKGFNDSGRRGLQVKVSTDYSGSGDPTNATWTDVSDQVTFSEGDFNFVESGEVDLSDSQFQSDAVYVAFQYQSSGPFNAATWEVDNIQVTGTPPIN
ncbi:DUF5017 domain-containing protein [Salinibacter ruber]|uniref:DUF5017 domain-containing protein n=1 Tax=Salinibacter ruber TaxID=146919 RepID=UPI0021685099|nr:DUF5017 domain-containing protein [Salinibacter ruber]MCS3698043.1 hypothetical protein [Salinibacter ruber]